MRNPTRFKIFIRSLALLLFGVSSLHLTLGLGADALLGVDISTASLHDPGLDSQNRFYGVCLSLFGAVLWIGSNNLIRYAPIVELAFLIMFIAGTARFVSVAVLGCPPHLVGVLFISELIIPPLAWAWMKMVLSDAERA